MGPGVITSRTVALTTPSSASRVQLLYCPRYRTARSLNPCDRREESDTAEKTVEGPAHLVGQGGVGAGRVAAPSLRAAGGDQAGIQYRLRLADQAAVEAFKLAQPPDQVRAAAPAAVLKLRGPVTGLLARGADEDQLVTDHPAAPGTLAPLRVALPDAAAITRQFPQASLRRR